MVITWTLLRIVMRARRPLPREDIGVVGFPTLVLGNFLGGGGLSRSAVRYCERLDLEQKEYIRVDTTSAVSQPVRNENVGGIIPLAGCRAFRDPALVVVHLNPPHFLLALFRLGRDALANKRIVAYWAWELEELPPIWRLCLAAVDEIEVPSSFTQKAVARYTTKPIRVVPPFGKLKPMEAQCRSFGVSGKLRCLFIFDMASLSARKNPTAVIEAFTSAFTPKEGELTIKLLSPSVDPVTQNKLHLCQARYPHVRILEEWLDDAQLDSLYNEHDVYISLHCSEGFGSTIYEAMCKGLYVVATGWSGNMDFLQGDRVHPVPYTLERIPPDLSREFGLRDSVWAAADTRAAARALKDIYAQVFPENFIDTTIFPREKTI